ncbi:MAG: ATP-binding protein [Thermodesulfobacteriota bacterium]
MKTSKRKQKKLLWRLALGVGLVAEIILIAISISSLVEGNNQVPLWQAMLFMVIAVWIYIAYLKQQAVDISRFVVDEKIKTHSLVQNLREGIMVVDPDNHILLLNAKASEIMGLPEIESLGQDLSTKVDDAIGSILRSGQTGESEGKITETGCTVRMSVIHLPADTRESGHKLIYVCRSDAPHETPDKTDAEGGEQCKIRTAKILRLMADELGRSLDHAPNPEACILRARLVLQGLIAGVDLLGGSAITKIKNGTLAGSLEKVDLSLSMLLQEILAEVAPVTSAAGIKFDFPADNGRFLLSGDPELTGLALRHVVYNAALASDPERGPVIIRSGSMGANIGIAITDQGSSVSYDGLQQIFADPYAGVCGPQGGMVRTEGSGLFMARGIIEAHGGTLIAESPPEGGLRVTIMTPGKS